MQTPRLANMAGGGSSAPSFASSHVASGCPSTEEVAIITFAACSVCSTSCTVSHGTCSYFFLCRGSSMKYLCPGFHRECQVNLCKIHDQCYHSDHRIFHPHGSSLPTSRMIRRSNTRPWVALHAGFHRDCQVNLDMFHDQCYNNDHVYHLHSSWLPTTGMTRRCSTLPWVSPHAGETKPRSARGGEVADEDSLDTDEAYFLALDFSVGTLFRCTSIRMRARRRPQYMTSRRSSCESILPSTKGTRRSSWRR